MYDGAVDCDACLRRIEGFAVELTERFAIYRVGPGGAELLQVEQARAVSDFLVGHEGYLQRGMGQLRVRRQACEQRHDLGHTGLVVGRQQGGAVAANDIASDELRQVGHLFGRRGYFAAVHDAGNKRPAFVVHDMRFHVLCRCIERGV